MYFTRISAKDIFQTLQFLLSELVFLFGTIKLKDTIYFLQISVCKIVTYMLLLERKHFWKF